MTDNQFGACLPALANGSGLIIDPTVADAKTAIKTAYDRAALDGATLFLAFIGHGERSGDDFYLMPTNAANPPDSDTALHLTNIVKESHRKARGQIDGLGVLVDACYAGIAGFDAARTWISGLSGTLRFEVLTAAADRPAANGCFSRALVDLLRRGVATEPTEHLQCSQLRKLIEQLCPNQIPQNPSYNPDFTLWISRNSGRVSEPWARTPLADEIQRLATPYLPTQALREVVKESQLHRFLCIVGNAGTGKSALAAAMAWPRVTEGIVPSGFVQGIVLLNEATTPRALATSLAAQLTHSVPEFLMARAAFERETPSGARDQLGALEREIIGPLRRLSPVPESVRLIVDSLDRLSVGATVAVMEALSALARIQFVRLVLSARPDTKLPPEALVYSLGPPAPLDVREYLRRRGVTQRRIDEAADAARDNWLVARVIADLLCESPDSSLKVGPVALSDSYEEMLQRTELIGIESVSPVLAVLAAAGVGPVLPLTLLCNASEQMKGPSSPATVRDKLVQLRGLVTRAAAGTDEEHVGLFHQTFVEYVAARMPAVLSAAHASIARAIEVLSPAQDTVITLGNAIERYAFEREASHLVALGEIQKAFLCLNARKSPIPRDNVRRWQSWLPIFESSLGKADSAVLRIRAIIAESTGLSGEPHAALQLFLALLPEQIEALGNDHADTLKVRNNVAHWTGECGDASKALQLNRELLLDQTRILGPTDSETLTTRGNVAHWTGLCGDARAARDQFIGLLPDELQAIGGDCSQTLATRNNIAQWTGECGDVSQALSLLNALLPDQFRVLGLDHPDTLTTKNNIAYWTSEGGDARSALKLWLDLLPEQIRVLGADHPDTLMTRNNIASLTGRCGDARAALKHFAALLPDQVRVLGADHPDVLSTRNNAAHWTGECGEAAEALRLLTALLPDFIARFGPNHRDTLTIRNNIAESTGKSGDTPASLRLFNALLQDRIRILGDQHPDTLKTRSSLARWTERAGNII
jgi:hypothetical protein